VKIKCITNKRTVTVENKRYSFSYGDIKELPDSAMKLAETPFFEAVKEIKEETKIKKENKS
jgi:hypothetical protein